MDPPALATSYSRFLLVKYVNIGAATFIVCENLANLEREIELVWTSRWSVPKVLYLLARYLPYMQALPEAILYVQTDLNYVECRATAKVAWVGILVGAVLCAILQLRLHAIYSQALWIRITTIAMFVATAVAVCGIAGLHIGGDIGAVPGLSLCIATVPESYYAFWLPPMLFDLGMTVLVCIKAAEHFRNSVDTTLAGCRLMSIIVRDSVLYFICVFAMYLFNMLVWRLCPPDYVELGPLWAVAITSAAITRMVLNLRETSLETELEWDDIVTFELRFSPTVSPDYGKQIAADNPGPSQV